jgi:hypothetical protein
MIDLEDRIILLSVNRVVWPCQTVCTCVQESILTFTDLEVHQSIIFGFFYLAVAPMADHSTSIFPDEVFWVDILHCKQTLTCVGDARLTDLQCKCQSIFVKVRTLRASAFSQDALPLKAPTVTVRFAIPLAGAAGKSPVALMDAFATPLAGCFVSSARAELLTWA